MPEWVQHSIWWQVYPLGFLAAEPNALPADAPPVHRLTGLVDWLAYLTDLGASGLALGPVFASGSHGYDTTDYYAIDPRLGTVEDFDTLVSQAHSRGIRVLLDGVFNHVGRGFPAFEQALAEGPGSPMADWFHLTWGTGGGEPDYGHFEGHRQLVTLNHGSQAVVDLVADVMIHWLDRGADGWRLDAAYAVPMEFWARVLPLVRARHPQAYIVGEVIHGDYAAFVTEGTLDSVTQYELWKAVWSSLNDVNLHELAWSLQRHDEFAAGFAPLTFVGNHDVTRIASRLDDDRHLAHALAVLMTTAGTPSIYYGDEQGMRGVKEDRPGGDDAVRPSFPATPASLPPDGWPIYHLHQLLIGVRRRNPWLHRSRLRIDHVTNAHLVWTASADGSAITTALSTGEDPVTLDVPGAIEILAGHGRLGGTASATTLTLEPHGWAVLSVRPAEPGPGR